MTDYFNFGDFAESLGLPSDAEIRRSLGQKSDNLDAFIEAYKKDDFARALSELESVDVEQSGLLAVLRAACEFGLKHYMDALNQCQLVTAPEVAYAAYYLQGKCHDNLGQLEEAVRAYDHSLSTHPNPVRVLLPKARALMKLERLDEAIEVCENVLDCDSRSVEALNMLGSAYAMEGDLTGAGIIYDEALAIEPNSAEVLRNKGLLFFQMGKFRDAVEQLRHATTSEPENVTGWCQLGATYGKMAMYDEVKRCFGEAVKLNPRDGTIWNDSGISLLEVANKTGDTQIFNEAVDRFEKALEHSKGKAAAGFRIAWRLISQHILEADQYAKSIGEMAGAKEEQEYRNEFIGKVLRPIGERIVALADKYNVEPR